MEIPRSESLPVRFGPRGSRRVYNKKSKRQVPNKMTADCFVLHEDHRGNNPMNKLSFAASFAQVKG
jgi:hypothetical protein